MRGSLRRFCLVATALLPLSAWAGTAVPFTINLSTPVNVVTSGGTPRIAVDVGGTTRYANYTSGSGTSALVFTYNMTAGDVDLDGVAVSSPVQLNGGTIKDLSGNPLTNLTFTPPNTAGVKVNYPSLGMDFTNGAGGRYTLNGTPYTTLASFLTAAGGSFTRASVGTYFDSAGVLQTAASGAPRFDYDPVTHAAKGILIEESRTNVLPRSGEFDNASWSKSNATITANAATAPDGTMTADKIATASSAFDGVLSAYSFTANQYYTISIYAKAAEASYLILGTDNSAGYMAQASFNLTNGIYSTTGHPSPTANRSATMTSIGNGWYKCTFTFQFIGGVSGVRIMHSIAAPTVSGYGYNHTGDGTSGIYIWGAQLEQGAFATSYIPTTTAAVTRAADSLTLSTASGWVNSTLGTWFAHFNGGLESTQGLYGRVVSPDGSKTALSIDGNNAFLGMYTYSSNSQKNTLANFLTTSGGAALAYNETLGTFSLTGRGLSPTVGSYSGNFNSTGGVIGIGRNAGGTTNMLNGNIQKLKYYPARVPNAQLQLMTQ